jgi:phosphoribosylamine--glycine ligase
MGGWAPTPAVTPALEREISARIVTPVLRALAQRGTPYRGALYAGLMLTASGPQVIEFNARFGDPETQCTLPLLEGSLARLLTSAAHGALEPQACPRSDHAAVTLALVDEGYPDAVHGGVLHGLDLAERSVLVFHAGTRRAGAAWEVRGGRAAYLTALASTLGGAGALLASAHAQLSGTGWRCRTDIIERVPDRVPNNA